MHIAEHASPGGFSIHALLAESDGQALNDIKAVGIFLSTLSLRRATRIGGADYHRNQLFYPRSPCGERR